MSFFSALSDFLFSIAFYLPYLIGGFVIAGVVLLSILLATVWRGKRAGKALAERIGSNGASSGIADPYDTTTGFLSEAEPLPSLPLRQSFRRAVRLLRDHVNARDYKYAIPWYLLIGRDGAGASSLAESAGLNLPLGRPEEDWEGARDDIKWWFFDRGVLLDVPGEYIRTANTSRRRAGAASWSKLLSLLEAYRPKRPIDGIVVAIPLDDLLDPEGRALPNEVLRRNAEPLYKRVWEAQTRTGLSVPIYIMLTKGDLLPGFEPFVQNLPSHAVKDMFGWSNPNDYEVQYKDAWTTIALNTLANATLNAQLALCTEKRHVPGVELTQKLPSAINALSEPLTQYLHTIFKPSAFHEGFALRGLFLTGAGAGAGAGVGAGQDQYSAMAHAPSVFSDPHHHASGSLEAEGAHSIAFVHDVFSRKIFPEYGLARPVRRTMLNRNRRVSLAQFTSAAILAIGALGLVYSNAILREEMETVIPYVEDVGRALSDVEAARSSGLTGGGDNTGSFNREDTLKLLEDMTRLNADSLWALWIPTSWFSSLDDELIEHSVHAYDEIILKSMRAGLIEQGRLLAAGKLPDAHLLRSSSLASQDSVVADELGVATKDLDEFVSAVRLYESEIDRFNALRERGRTEDISELVEYLYGVALPESFNTNAGFYTRALEQIDSRDLDISPLSEGVSAKVADLVSKSASDAFQTSPLIQRLQTVAGRLDQGATRRGGAVDALEEISQDLNALSELVTEPRYRWLNDEDFNPITTFAGTIEHISGSQLLGPEIATLYADALDASVVLARRIAAQTGSFTLGVLLENEDGVPQPKLSSEAEALRDTLAGLFAKPFMEERRVKTLPPPAVPTTPVFWNKPLLEEAITLIDGYDAFVRDELIAAPRALHTLISTAAGERLEKNANNLIAQAYVTRRGGRGRGLRREDLVRQEVQELEQALPELTSIIQFYRAEELESSALSLTDLAALHSYGLLETIDELFAAEPFYEPRDASFSNWSGQENAALLAFAARDDATLREFLSSQRDRIILLATDYAAPVLSFLSEGEELPFSGGELALIRQWRGIAEEAEKYVLRKSGNSITALEAFILGDMSTARINTCSEVFSSDPLLAFEADYFLEQRNFLNEQLSLRCQLIAGDEAVGAYNVIADAFAANLQGKYPFARGPYQRDQREATTSDIQNFFAVFDANRDSAGNALESASLFGPDRQLARVFLNQLDEVRGFFSGLLSEADRSAAPVYTVNIDFRVNRAREVNANQVIEWRAEVNGQERTVRSSDQALRWSLGDPISLSFRWADSAPLTPAASGSSSSGGSVSRGGAGAGVGLGALRVTGRTASLEFNNLWSLIDLVRRQSARAEDFQDLVDPRPHTLRFDIPTRPRQGGQISISKLFIRTQISVLEAGKATPVTVPPFPVSAPLLDR